MVIFKPEDVECTTASSLDQ